MYFPTKLYILNKTTEKRKELPYEIYISGNLSKNRIRNLQSFFPDLECCYAEGDTLDEAIDNANAAAYDWLSLELSEEDGLLPSISDESDMPLQEGDIVRNIAVNIRFTDGWDE